MIKTTLFAAAAALATIATASPVLAKDVLVRYGDLDLATAQGQTKLAHRINRAAREACDFASDGRLPSTEALACHRQAVAKSRTEVASAIQNASLGG